MTLKLEICSMECMKNVINQTNTKTKMHIMKCENVPCATFCSVQKFQPSRHKVSIESTLP